MWPFVALVALAGCGRVDFADLDAPALDAPAPPIAWVQSFAQRHPGAGLVDSFPAQARTAGDALVLQVACSGGGVPTAVVVTAPGWTFVPLGPLTTGMSLAAASFGAIAPDAAATTVTVTWTAPNCNVGKSELGDEFTHTDGAAPFDAHVEAFGTGDAFGRVTTGRAGDAVWGACFSATSLIAVGPGYTRGADNTGGDWAEYKITSDPAGTQETVTFANPNVPYVLDVIALTPAFH